MMAKIFCSQLIKKFTWRTLLNNTGELLASYFNEGKQKTSWNINIVKNSLKSVQNLY